MSNIYCIQVKCTLAAERVDEAFIEALTYEWIKMDLDL